MLESMYDYSENKYNESNPFDFAKNSFNSSCGFEQANSFGSDLSSASTNNS